MKEWHWLLLIGLACCAILFGTTYFNRIVSNITVQTRIDHPRPGIECYGLITDKGAAVSCYPTKGL